MHKKQEHWKFQDVITNCGFPDDPPSYDWNDDHDHIRYGEEEGNFHIIIVNDNLEDAYLALRC